MLSVAFKNVVGARRSSWRTVSAIQTQAATESNASTQKLADSLCVEIKGELMKICTDVLVSFGELLARGQVAIARHFLSFAFCGIDLA